MIWSVGKLHFDQISLQRRQKSAMSNALALEGLEDYDPPQNGDTRKVESIAADFIYFDLIHAWIRLI